MTAQTSRRRNAETVVEEIAPVEETVAPQEVVVSSPLIAGAGELVAARKVAEDLAAEHERRNTALKELLRQWLAREINGADLDVARDALHEVAAQKTLAETTFRTLREASLTTVNAKVKQAKTTIQEAMKKFLAGEIGPEELVAVRESWKQAEDDATAAKTELGAVPRKVGGGTGGTRPSQAIGNGEGGRAKRVLRVNAKGDLAYKMNDDAFAALQERLEDAEGMDDIIARLAVATVQSKGRHMVLLSRAQAERIQPFLATSIEDMDDGDAAEKAHKRQFGLLKLNVDEFVAGPMVEARVATEGGDDADEAEDTEDEADEAGGDDVADGDREPGDEE